MRQWIYLVAGLVLGCLAMTLFPTAPVYGSRTDYELKKLQRKFKDMENKFKRFERKHRDWVKKRERWEKDHEKRHKEQEKRDKERTKEFKNLQKNFKNHTHEVEMRAPGRSWQNDRYREFKISGQEIRIGKVKK